MNLRDMMKSKGGGSLSGKNRPMGISSRNAGRGRSSGVSSRPDWMKKKQPGRGAERAPGRMAAMRERFRGEAAKALETKE